MKRTSDKDLYSILGVSPKASSAEIREAYLARMRVIHPDRFDRQKQAKDWRQANDMLAELNEAYAILRNAESRSDYDASRKRYSDAPPRSHPEPEPPPRTPFEVGELTRGYALFGSLARHVQERLLKRQQNLDEDQLQISLASEAWNYVFITILQFWLWYLFINAAIEKWSNLTLFWYALITLCVGGLIGRNIISIRRWMKITLKSYFYITPIYFLKTEFDSISFHPIWMLKDVRVTHNYNKRIYQDSTVTLKFDDHSEKLSLRSKRNVEDLLERIRLYDEQARAAYANHDQEYFLRHDDFYRVPRLGAVAPLTIPKRTQKIIYSLSLFVCAAALLIARATNAERSPTDWVRHSSPPVVAPAVPTPEPVVEQSYPAQPLPESGSLRSFTKKKRIAPFQIDATQASHNLVKLVDAQTGAAILTVFVQGGSITKVHVPLGTYEVRCATGDSWYGYEYLFGPDTTYSKTDETFSFNIEEEKIRGYTITLYKVADGNLHTSPIEPDKF